MINQFPPDFQAEINRLLTSQSGKFWQALESGEPYLGIRTNTLKTSSELLKGYFPELEEAVPWETEGFQVKPQDQYGKHPLHAAGLFYLQEPSAMASVQVLDPQPGELILDLCAAPGGKTTQMLSRMENRGTLIANDPNPSRIQALVRNVDRWGAHNAIITNESPKRLANHFGGIFDRVLVDAPCSGEGMFRSDPGEVSRWTPKFKTRSAAIQDEILWFAGKLVRPGGILVYSTCTFNQLENEGAIARFLEKNPQYSIDAIPDSPGFSSGIVLDIENRPELRQTKRIWPHLAPGEGHYIARLIRSKRQIEWETGAVNNQIQNAPDQIKIYRDFFNKTLQATQRTRKIKPDSSSLALIGNQLYHIPPKSPSPSGIRVLRWGWLIGTVRSNRFIPSSAFALGLSRRDVQMMIEFPLEDRDLKKYLSGSPIANSRFNFPEKAWILVTVEGFPLGWGKLVQGRIKSHFPVWLRAI